MPTLSTIGSLHHRIKKQAKGDSLDVSLENETRQNSNVVQSIDPISRAHVDERHTDRLQGPNMKKDGETLTQSNSRTQEKDFKEMSTPLKSARLRPIRQKTRNAVVSFFKD